MTIQPGETIETTITRIGNEGDGVGEYNGLNVIVPKTAAGDKISCVVKYSTKNRIHADLSSITEASSARVEAPCEYYSTCGGCGLQHINAEEYKNYKLGILTTALKYANIPLPTSIGWVSVGEKSRRRAFVRFDKNNSPKGEGKSGRLGFYEHQSHNVVNLKHCMILEPELEAMLAPLLQFCIQLSINIEGWSVTNTDNGIDLIMQGDYNHKTNNEATIIKKLSEFAKNAGINRLSWKRGKKNIPVLTIETPYLTIAERKISLPYEYFLQASKAGQDAILEAVIPNVADGAKVLDLFSGLGIYSFALADKAEHISACEISPEMVKSMEKNITSNNLSSKITVYCRDIEKNPLNSQEIAKFDTAIINPPRTGALSQISKLAAARVAKIIIVSCNSQTFARDAKVLHENGYKLKALNTIDQFFYSHHLEQVGVFEL